MNFNFLIELFYNNEPIVQKNRPSIKMAQYLTYEIIRLFDIKTFKVQLTPKGIALVSILLRKLGRDIGKPSGIALEKREWVNVADLRFSAEDTINAFKSICDRANVEYKIHTDPFGRTKFITFFLEKGLLKLSMDSRWESTGKDVDVLKKIGWSESEIWLWSQYLDDIYKDIRDVECQQEFIIWQD
jgi:hypothetical protein